MRNSYARMKLALDRIDALGGADVGFLVCKNYRHKSNGGQRIEPPARGARTSERVIQNIHEFCFGSPRTRYSRVEFEL
jgi:hypothetical protein